MKTRAKTTTREGPVKIAMTFDEAIKRTLQVKPPREGWAQYGKKPKKERKRKRQKKAA
jgi:hypothetical protein